MEQRLAQSRWSVGGRAPLVCFGSEGKSRDSGSSRQRDREQGIRDKDGRYRKREKRKGKWRGRRRGRERRGICPRVDRCWIDRKQP